MENPPQLNEFYTSGKNLFKLNKYAESLSCFEEILKQSFSEQIIDDKTYDIIEDTINYIRLIATKLHSNSAEKISILYDEFLMHKQKMAYIPQAEKRQKLVQAQCVNASQELLPLIGNMMENLTNKNSNSRIPLIAGFTVGAVAASAATYYYVHNKHK